MIYERDSCRGRAQVRGSLLSLGYALALDNEEYAGRHCSEGHDNLPKMRAIPCRGAADFVSAPLPLSVIMIAVAFSVGPASVANDAHRKNGHDRNTGCGGRRGRRRELRLFPLEPLPCQDAARFVSQPCCRRSTEWPETETKTHIPWRRQRRPSPARGRCRDQPASVPAFCSLPTSAPVGLARTGLFGFHVIAFAGRAETSAMQGRKTTRACKLSATIPLSRVSAANAIVLHWHPPLKPYVRDPPGGLKRRRGPKDRVTF